MSPKNFQTLLDVLVGVVEISAVYMLNEGGPRNPLKSRGYFGVDLATIGREMIPFHTRASGRLDVDRCDA